MNNSQTRGNFSMQYLKVNFLKTFCGNYCNFILNSTYKVWTCKQKKQRTFYSNSLLRKQVVFKYYINFKYIHIFIQKSFIVILQVSQDYQSKNDLLVTMLFTKILFSTQDSLQTTEISVILTQVEIRINSLADCTNTKFRVI